MTDNVSEWCKDWYAYSYYSQSPTDDPQGPGSGSDRVRRGGSWDNYDYYSGRCASRYYYDPNGYWYTLGFRISR